MGLYFVRKLNKVLPLNPLKGLMILIWGIVLLMNTACQTSVPIPTPIPSPTGFILPTATPGEKNTTTMRVETPGPTPIPAFSLNVCSEEPLPQELDSNFSLDIHFF